MDTILYLLGCAAGWVYTKVRPLVHWYTKDFVIITDWLFYQSDDIHEWAATAPNDVIERATFRRCPYVRNRSARELGRRAREGTYCMT